MFSSINGIAGIKTVRAGILSCLFCIISFSGLLFAQAKYQPPAGCYPGAFIVNDPVVAGSVASFESLTGKKHATYFSYTSWGQPFPSQWVNDYASGNRVVQIAFEPNGGLAQVTDGDYIRNWAREARRSGAMILLRWASEMNGSWVAWYGNPQLYIEKFRLIAEIMKQEAPNVAMVWCPNDIPNEPGSPPDYIHSYYPGDDYADWVGIDFYCVYFHEDGTPERTLPWSKLETVYAVYSNRKPVIICEWAAAHYTTRVTPALDCSSYCIAMTDSLYMNLQSRYPKVKAVNWFSMNSLSQNKCNFSLTENATVMNNYKNVISPPYFLSEGYRNVPKVVLSSLRQDTVIRNSVVISPSVFCDTGIDSVVYKLDGARFAVSTASPFSAQLITSSFADGFHKIRVSAYSGAFSNYEEVQVIIDNGGNYFSAIIDDSVSSAFGVSGNWVVSASQPDRYGAYYHAAPAGNGSSVASWYFNIPAAGFYKVSAWWSIHSNRATNSPYTVTHNGGTDTIKVNQQVNGGMWNALCTKYFSQGQAKVTLNNNANGYVIADAIKFEYAFTSNTKDSKSGSPVSVSRHIYFYPNPARGNCTIEMSASDETASALIRVVNILGQEVMAFPLELKKDLPVVIPANVSTLPAGIYFASAVRGARPVTVKFLVVK